MKNKKVLSFIKSLLTETCMEIESQLLHDHMITRAMISMAFSEYEPVNELEYQ
jgi:hypothetical protein